MKVKLVKPFVPLFEGISFAFSDLNGGPVAMPNGTRLAHLVGRVPVPIITRLEGPGDRPLFPVAEVWETKLCELGGLWVTPDDLPEHVSRNGYGSLDHLFIVDVFFQADRTREWVRSGLLVVPRSVAMFVKAGMVRSSVGMLPSDINEAYPVIRDMLATPFNLIP